MFPLKTWSSSGPVRVTAPGSLPLPSGDPDIISIPKWLRKSKGCRVRLNTPLGLPYIHIEVCTLCHFSACESWGWFSDPLFWSTCDLHYCGGWVRDDVLQNVHSVHGIFVTILNQFIQKLRRRDPRWWLWMSGEPLPNFHARSIVTCGSSIGQDLRVTKWLPYVLPVAPLTCGDWTREQICMKTPCGTRNWGSSPRHGY